MNPFAFPVICLAGWMNRNQQEVIEYLQKEVRVFKELLIIPQLCSSGLCPSPGSLEIPSCASESQESSSLNLFGKM